MKLGILITTDKNNDAVVGLTKAAVSKGHEVFIFCTDAGVNMVKNKAFTDLSTVGGVKMGYCDHSGKAPTRGAVVTGSAGGAVSESAAFSKSDSKMRTACAVWVRP